MFLNTANISHKQLSSKYLFLDGRRRRNWFFGIFDISFARVGGGG